MRAILLALLVSTGAHALTRDDITRDSECGAPGIGEIWAGEKRGQIEQRDGAPGVRVNAEGFWEIGCKPALQPAGPAGCPGGGPVGVYQLQLNAPLPQPFDINPLKVNLNLRNVI